MVLVHMILQAIIQKLYIMNKTLIVVFDHGGILGGDSESDSGDDSLERRCTMHIKAVIAGLSPTLKCGRSADDRLVRFHTAHQCHHY